MVELNPGDVLSYSAGSTQISPMGFRKVQPRGGMMTGLARRWPDIVAALGSRPVLFINSYPATIGRLPTVITVDTYLNPRMLSRALQLGRVADHPVILTAQPLFIADALLGHIAAELALPATLMLWLGGYAMPESLERMLHTAVQPHVDHFSIVQYFGVAEVDAGCLMARERDHDGDPIYYPRDDVAVQLDDDALLLALRDDEGTPIGAGFRTGDKARPAGEGWVIWNDQRYHPEIKAVLRGWTEAQWRRRTGYVRRTDEALWIQLRQDETPVESADGARQVELEHYEFARRFGFSWLDKPYWR
ncbi:MAG: hypothetical protein AAGC55_32720 [Myxococcota bacterium]